MVNQKIPLSQTGFSSSEAVSPTGTILIPGPSEPASVGVIAAMVLARLGLLLAISTPITAGLVLKLQSLVAVDQVVGPLGVITSLGALAALLADPVFGRLSDRTTGRFGRRRPWLLIGSAGLVVALVIIALAPSVWVVGLGWLLGQIVANAAVAAHTATIADQLPPLQRGKVSGMIGLAQQAAVLGAAYSAQFLSSQMLLLFLVPGLIGLVLVTLYAIVLPDVPLTRRPRSEGGVALVLKTFWVSPRKYPDFAFAWGSRFLIVLASFMFTTFRLLWIQHELGLEKAQAAQVLSTGVLCYTVSLVVAGLVAGWVSDKIGRRKPFIIGSAMVFAVGTLLLIFAQGASGFFLAEVVLGFGFGVYVAVDLALILDLLPNPDDAGKDLGVFNIAVSAPQVLAPGVAALLIGLSDGGSYNVMLIGAAILALIGGALILFVRKVK